MFDLDADEGRIVPIHRPGHRRPLRHVLERRTMAAVNAALIAERPLLVRGEPGVGKSQLAIAAARHFGWPFVSVVVDSRLEAQDLRWTIDHVSRMATAQFLGSGWRPSAPKEDSSQDPERAVLDLAMDERRFLVPGPIWWAFDWAGASQLVRAAPPEAPPETWDGGRAPSREDSDEGERHAGVVLLIDEIDKAQSDVPNGLLEALGDRQFRAPTFEDPIGQRGPVLTVFTTNEERVLPDAFVRRCFVLKLKMPEEEKLKRFFHDRGRAHFDVREISEEILNRAVDRILEARVAAREKGHPPPGQAELIDLLLAVRGAADAPTSEAEQRTLLETLAEFACFKHADPDEQRWA